MPWQSSRGVRTGPLGEAVGLLPAEALTPEILRGGEVERKRFDPRSTAPFVNKSVSEEPAEPTATPSPSSSGSLATRTLWKWYPLFGVTA